MNNTTLSAGYSTEPQQAAERWQNPWPWPLGELFQREPRYTAAAMCLVVLTLPTTIAMLLEPRTVADVNVWVKPAFEVRYCASSLPADTRLVRTVVAGRHNQSTLV